MIDDTIFTVGQVFVLGMFHKHANVCISSKGVIGHSTSSLKHVIKDLRAQKSKKVATKKVLL